MPVREPITLDRRGHGTSFAPNVIHSLDAAHLHLTVARARASNGDTPLGTIHDSFATCAADAAVLAIIFQTGFSTIYGRKRSEDINDDTRIVSDNNPLLYLDGQFRAQCPTIPTPPEQGDFDVGQVFVATPLR